MPAPYSDNMYSNLGQDASDDERDALSPTDGYFHASSSSDAASASRWPPHPDQQLPHRLSSNLPSVPNVLVEDPTLRAQGAADKAREAEEERLMNRAASHPASSSPYPPQVSTAASQAATYPPTSSSAQAPFSSSPAAAAPSKPSFTASHHHRRSVDDDERLHLPGHSTRLPYLHTPANSGETSNITSQPHHHSQLDAPPAYSPSPSSPPLSGPSQHQQGYQTFPSPPATARTDTMGVPEEHQALLPRQPESMGGRLGSPAPPKWQRIKESMASSNLRKRIKTILGVLVVLSIISAILGTGLSSSSSHRRNRGIFDKDPVRDPDMGGHSDLVWSAPSGCRDTPHPFSKTTATLRFGSEQTLDIRQEIEKSDTRNGRTPKIYGQINIRPAGDDASEGSIELEVISNDAALRVQVDKDLNGDRQLFKMITPRIIEWGSASGDAPCIQMRATVWIPRKAYLRSFTLSSVHLDVNVLDGLIMGVSDETKISTVAGDFRTSLPKDVNEDIVPYTLESRKIRIETVSGDVKGWFPLYDLLKISTTSGDITTQVAPKPADKKSPEPAVLDVSTVSGHVEVMEPLNGALNAGKPDRKLPARDYITKLSSTSGKIKGEVASSSEGKFQSTSGNTALKVLPIFEKDSGEYLSKPPTLTTNSMSGDWRVTVLEPLWTSTSGVNSNAKPALDFLQSKHQTISGTMQLFYPSTWEGRFHAQSMSGSVKISGDGVEIIRRNRGWRTSIEGKKGDGNSEIVLDSVSGDMKLAVGGNSS